jgi:hypothetical protein
MGTNAFSLQWSKSFRHILPLPPPHSTPSLGSVAQGRLRLLTADASRRILESPLERVRRSYRLYVDGYALMPEHVRSLRSLFRRNIVSEHECFGASALFRSKEVAEQKCKQRQDGLCDHEIESKIQGLSELIGRRFVKIQDCFVILGVDCGCHGRRK